MLELLAVVDAWTLWHLFFGAVAGLRRMRLAHLLAVAVGWEIFERAHDDQDWLGTDLGDPNPINSLIDVAAAVLMWRLVQARSACLT